MNMETDKMMRKRSAEPAINSKKFMIPPGVPVWTSTRYCLAYMAFFGFFNVYALRVNLSVAIVSMANTANDSHKYSDECPDTSTNHTAKPGEFNWTSSDKALILGAFFYGYICTQVLGGYLASRYGGKWLFGGGVLCTTLFTLLTPIAARTSFHLLIATRVIEGLGEGVTFPAMHAIWGVWVPPLERSRLVSLGYAGSHFGTFIAQPISGVLCASDFLGGWPSVFYVFGTVALVWCILWAALIHNRPREHPRISSIELEYIESQVSQEHTAMSDVPWKEILTSVPVWGIVCSHFANNWGFYTLLTCLPMYLKYVLRFDMTQVISRLHHKFMPLGLGVVIDLNGLISALPYFVMWASINVSGFIADYLRERGILTTTQARKIFNTIGLIGPAIFLVAAGYTGCNNTLTVAFICIATLFNGCTFSGYSANHIDIASRYAGILMGITNTFATIPGFVSPIVVQALTGEDETRAAWRNVFFIAAGVYVVGAILYAIMSSGEEQIWNRPRYERLSTNENSISNGKRRQNHNKNNSGSNSASDIDDDSDVQVGLTSTEKPHVKA